MTGKAWTHAHQIGARLHNDGQVFADNDGYTLDDMAGDLGGRKEQHPRKPDVYRWVFGDGSVITVAGDAWDDGYSDCWCWAGVGHSDECQPASPRWRVICTVDGVRCDAWEFLGDAHGATYTDRRLAEAVRDRLWDDPYDLIKSGLVTPEQDVDYRVVEA